MSSSSQIKCGGRPTGTWAKIKYFRLIDIASKGAIGEDESPTKKNSGKEEVVFVCFFLLKEETR